MPAPGHSAAVPPNVSRAPLMAECVAQTMNAARRASRATFDEHGPPHASPLPPMPPPPPPRALWLEEWVSRSAGGARPRALPDAAKCPPLQERTEVLSTARFWNRQPAIAWFWQ